MAADPRLVAEFMREETVTNPPEEAAFRRNIRLAVTDDGFVRGSRVKEVLPFAVLPPTMGDQIGLEGTSDDNVQDAVSNLPTNYAPTNGTFITQTPNSTLTAEQALSLLSTGLLKVETGTGVLSIAVPGVDYTPAPLTATATLDFTSIAAQTCQGMTITVTGAAVNDAVVLAAPAGLENGLSATGIVTATNTVTVRLCNVTASPIDPASATWSAKVFPL